MTAYSLFKGLFYDFHFLFSFLLFHRLQPSAFIYNVAPVRVVELLKAIPNRNFSNILFGLIDCKFVFKFIFQFLSFSTLTVCDISPFLRNKNSKKTIFINSKGCK